MKNLMIVLVFIVAVCGYGAMPTRYTTIAPRGNLNFDVCSFYEYGFHVFERPEHIYELETNLSRKKSATTTIISWQKVWW